MVSHQPDHRTPRTRSTPTAPGTPVVYDDPDFFDAYTAFRAGSAGRLSNDALEHPAIRSLIPSPVGRDVLDIGCGTGDLSRWCARSGARSVLAVDPSARMIDRARELTGEDEAHSIRWLHQPVETVELDPGSLDLAVSSLALHYIADYPGLLRRVHRWLRPGGVLVYSTEHPVHTATASQEEGWCLDGTGDPRHWKLDDYGVEGPRDQRWLGTTVPKHHRRISTLLNALTGTGFLIEQVLEPRPDPTAPVDLRMTEYTRRDRKSVV